MSASRYAWMASALCAQADPDEWAEPTGSGQTPKRICQRCPVQAACDAHVTALRAYDGAAIHGIWGGRSQHQRESERRQAA